MAHSAGDRRLTVELAAQLFADLGYDGCRELREAIRLRMAEHRQMVAAEREAAGLARPRSRRGATSAAQAAHLTGGCSEAGVTRSKAIKRWAPHLVPAIMAGEISTWAAYQQAIRLRDQAAMQQALSG